MFDSRGTCSTKNSLNSHLDTTNLVKDSLETQKIFLNPPSAVELRIYFGEKILS